MRTFTAMVIDSMKLRLLPFLVCTLLGACSDSPDTASPTNVNIDDFADDYLFLELSMGRHDPAHVDAYFGPEEIQTAANEAKLDLEDIDSRTATLAQQLKAARVQEQDPIRAARIDGLIARLMALRTRIVLNQGETESFDEESRQLFGTSAPDHDAAHFDVILDEIDTLVPGDGPLSTRVNEFRDQFVIPADKLSLVFDAALNECRRRTLEYIDLPEHESFRVEFVNDKPWSGYNWYQGYAQSLIQINTDLPTFISRAVDLGCHEGYPGHHTFNALLEKNLVIGRGWSEFSLYPLFSPQSLIAEGSGNYGIELAFPGAERLKFEQEVLFPLAGLDASEADRYYVLLELMGKLNYAGNEAARDYLDGNMSREEAVQWLIDYSLFSPQRAQQRVDFIDTYRSYVINYNLGKDMVQQYIERDTSSAAERWEKFKLLLSTPMLPGDLL
jgi:hypothetical protein